MEKLKEIIELPSAVPKSPLSTWLCGTIKHVNQSEIHVDYTIRKKMTDSFSDMHTGIVALLQTEVAELMYYVLSGEEKQVITNIDNHFIRKAPLGTKVSVCAKSIPGHFRQEIETTIRNSEGQITAIGRVTFSAD